MTLRAELAVDRSRFGMTWSPLRMAAMQATGTVTARFIRVLPGTRSHGARAAVPTGQEQSGALMPLLFAAQGALPLVDYRRWAAGLGAWGQSLPRPRAILLPQWRTDTSRH